MKTNDVLTTGQVARICRVAPRTVSKWFDKGLVSGYRIPGSEDRRIPRLELLRFMRKHGMPLETLAADDEAHKVLAVGCSGPFTEALRAHLDDGGRWTVDSCRTPFEAGWKAAGLRPDCILVDSSLGRIEAGLVAECVRGAEARRDATLLLLLATPGDPDLPAGFDAVADHGLTMRALGDWIATEVLRHKAQAGWSPVKSAAQAPRPEHEPEPATA